MKIAQVNGIELEYDVRGSGEPLLLVSPVLADSVLPLYADPALARRYQVIRYHRRGWGGSTHTPPPVSIAQHAADAAALFEALGIRRGHVAGHSTGGAIAIQLALDRPDLVHALVLLEPTILTVPAAKGFLEGAAPALNAYAAGQHAAAFEMFMTAVSGFDWNRCHHLLEESAPGTTAAALKDIDTFFGIELPSVVAWQFGPAQASRISQRVLSVRGDRTLPLWVDIAELLRTCVPHVEERRIAKLGHLLHIDSAETVAHVIAEFLDRNAMYARPSELADANPS